MSFGRDEQENLRLLNALLGGFAQSGNFAPIERALDEAADSQLREDLLACFFWTGLDNGNPDLAERCLAAGYDFGPNESDPFGPLYYAIQNCRDRPEVVAWLLDHGADIEHRGLNNWTPLHQAIAFRCPAVAALLIERGADVNARTEIDNDETPLMLAAQVGLESVVCLLLSQGAERTAKNRWGETAADIARRAKHLEIAGLIETTPKLRSQRRQKKRAQP